VTPAVKSFDPSERSRARRGLLLIEASFVCRAQLSSRNEPSVRRRYAAGIGQWLFPNLESTFFFFFFSNNISIFIHQRIVW